MKNKILIELVITNSCNKRCEYCDLDFKNTFISDKSISLFIDFINKEKNIDYFHINFFGWEPLLWFEKIKKIINWINNKKVKYSIWTNWNLLNKEKLDFFLKNKLNISLSVNNITWFKNIYEIDKKYFKLIEINFINDPDYLFNSKKIFDKILNKWFKNINFMPVFTTKIWDNKNLIELWKIVKFIKNNFSDFKINYFNYFNWISDEKQFILDTDWYFYNDLDSLLWLQKQYSCLSKEFKKKIDNFTKNTILNKNININKLIENYNIKDIIKLVNEIPKNLKQEKQNILIEKILKNVK